MLQLLMPPAFDAVQRWPESKVHGRQELATLLSPFRSARATAPEPAAVMIDVELAAVTVPNLIGTPRRRLDLALRSPRYRARTGIHSSQVSEPVRASSADTAENRSKHGRSSHCRPLDGSHSRVSQVHAWAMAAGAPLNCATA